MKDQRKKKRNILNFMIRDRHFYIQTMAAKKT